MKQMRKGKSDPRLYTPNAFLRARLGIGLGDLTEENDRRFESLVSEQYWKVREAPPKFIDSLKDPEGFLKMEDVELPFSFHVDPTKSMSLTECFDEPVIALTKHPAFKNKRLLAVWPWSGGKGVYAQIGCFKSRKDELNGYVTGPLIKRGALNYTYYYGRFFDLLKAMREVGLLSPWSDDYEDVVTD